MAKFGFLYLVSATLGSLFTEGVRIKEVIKHLDEIAYKSLNIVIVCVSFAASVTILEASFHMKLVLHDDSLVPGFASMLIVRELAVVVMSLLLSAKVGAGIAAEVGQMKISEQTDALKLLGINPFNYLVLPRLVACLMAGLILSLVANAACLIAALGVTVYQLDQSVSFFLMGFRRFVLMKDLLFSIIKGMAFCSVIPLVSCYYGMTCQPGAAGVGRATTKSVVTSSIAIIVIDFLLTYLFSLLY